jgi:CubicO group peptidase (beta-lactamase class C family)
MGHRIDRMFVDYAGEGPGCTVAVVRDGKLLSAHAYGLADLDHEAPLVPDSVFHVASLSKQFTAFSIVLLEHRGKLSLDDDVRRWIPELPAFGGRRITLRHLLWHTSGLRDQWDLLDMAGWRVEEDIVTTPDILALVARQRDLNFDPGAEFYYSNTNYTLLGVIVERASGKSLRKFAEDEIFRPLSMTHTFFRDDHTEVVAGRALAYEKRADGAWHRFIPGFDTVGATSLFTTALDLGKWGDNFDHPVVGDTAMMAEMVEPGQLNDGTILHYAKGLGVGRHRGVRVVEHGGNDAGYYASFLRFPDQHLAVACLCATGQNIAVDHGYRVADLYLGDAVQAPAPAPPSAGHPPGVYYHAGRDEVVRIAAGQTPNLGAGFVRVEPPAASPLERYAGSYWSDELGVGYEVILRDGTLFLSRRKHADAPLRIFQEAGFTSDGYVIHFLEDAMTLTTGRVRRLRFTRAGRPNVIDSRSGSAHLRRASAFSSAAAGSVLPPRYFDRKASAAA